jgi:acetyl-CoA carboxylase biotin carboxyl carrier protein
MNVKELKEMINLMQENGLTELEIEKNGLKVRLKKGSSGGIMSEVAGQLVQPTRIPTETISTSPVAEKEAGITVVRSPMVGTFYTAPAPDVAPYVASGQDVKPDDVLCIIEAMKLMNEIKCEVRGKVTEILVQNGQPVEFDQPLFKIKS